MFTYKSKRTVFLFSGLIVLLMLIAFSFGYLARMSGKQPQEGSLTENADTEKGKETGDEVREVSKTGPDSVLVFKRSYTRCRHTLEEETEMDSGNVGKTGKQLKRAFPEWQLAKFTPEEVTFRKSIDGYCPNHYVIKAKEGYLVIYRPEKDTGKLEAVEESNISYRWLSPEMKEQVDKGLAVDSREAVERLMENLES
ncbi:hypothetical protein QBE55_12840 [Eubacteriales bacterium mix99]